MGGLFSSENCVEFPICVVGLDAGGKQTLLRRIGCDKIQQRSIDPIGIPYRTALSRAMSVRSGGESTAAVAWKITTWDFANARGYRRACALLYATANAAVIFVVDAADHARLPEAAQELAIAAKDENLLRTPFLIFANKSDLPGALSAPQVCEALRLHEVFASNQHFCVQASCAATGAGVAEGMKWLGETLCGS